MKLITSLSLGMTALAMAVSSSASEPDAPDLYLSADQAPLFSNQEGNITREAKNDFVRGEVLVRFKPQFYNQAIGARVKALADLNLPVQAQALFQRFGVSNASSLLQRREGLTRALAAPQGKQRAATEQLSRWVKLSFDKNQKVSRFLDALKADSSVEMAEPNYVVTVAMTPNDPYWSSSDSWGQGHADLWGLKAINAQSAWDVTQGAGVVVAVVDSGLYTGHSDIAANVWTNTGEIAGNGIDDDLNGYVDDVNGWDFVDNDAVVNDGHGHGTHVAGTIAAVANNNTGIIGVAPQAKVMPLKALGSNGSGSTSDLVAALTYAADMGADVINNSWGGSYSSSAFKDAVDYAHAQGAVVIVAAGNDSQDARYQTPAEWDSVITVGALEYVSASAEKHARYSNYGAKIDVVAPGSAILSLLSPGSSLSGDSGVVGTDYLQISGTSMAAPHVSGLVALMLANNPQLTPEQVRNVLKASADDIGYTGWDSIYGAGKINAAAALAYSQTTADLLAGIHSPSPYGDSDENTFVNGAMSITGNASGSNFQSYTVEYASIANHVPGTFSTIASDTSPVVNDELATWNTASLADGEYVLRLTVTDSNGKSSQAYQLFTKDSTLVSGWPALTAYTGIPTSSKYIGASEDTVIDDITGDGVPEMIHTMDDYLFVKDLAGNELLTKYIGHSYAFAGSNSPVALADLDGDGDKEIIYVQPQQIYPTSSESGASFLRAIHHNGTAVTGFPAAPWPASEITSNGIYARSGGVAPIVTDLEGDGVKDIVLLAGSYNLLYPRVYLFAVDAYGNTKPGFPVLIDDDYHATTYPPVVADFDGDGDQEIVILKPNYEPNSDPQVVDNVSLKVYGYDGVLERERALPNFLIENISFINGELCGPKVADLDRDGQLDLMFVTSATQTSGYNDLYVVDGELNDKSGFPVSAQGSNVSCNFSASNLDADDELEIYMPAFNQVNAYNHDGTQVSGFSVALPAYHYNYGNLSLFATDSYPYGIGIGNYEVRTGVNDVTGLRAYTHDGTYVPEWSKNIGFSVSTYVPMTAPDVNGDVYFGAVNQAGVAYLFKKNVGSADAINWSGIQGGVDRTGVHFDANPVTPPSNTCTEYTATNSQHVTAGRAYRTGTWFYTYYANGSDEVLGSYGYTTTTLAETSAGYFIKGNCPAPQASAPVVQSLYVETLNGDVTVSGTASDVDGDLSSVEIEFDDSGTWITVTGTSTWSYDTTLSSGSHSVKARAKDMGGLTGEERGPKSFTAIDPRPPEVSGYVFSVVEDDVTFKGSASDEDGDLDKVEVELDGNGTWITATGTESWELQVTGVSVGAHTAVFRATDLEGQTTLSSTVNFTVVTPTAPTCEISFVDQDNSNGIHYAPISASDVNNNLAGVEFRIDGGAWEAAQVLFGYIAVMEDNPNEIAPGNHTLEARAYDGGGLYGNCAAAVNFTVASPAAPVVETIELEPLNDGADMRVYGEISDVNKDFSKVELELNNSGQWLDIGQSSYYSHTYTGLANGTYDVRVRATDYAGNVSAVAGPESFTIGGDPGTAPTIDSASTSTSGLDVTVSGAASDVDGDLSVIEVEFDGSGTWYTATGLSTFTYTTTLSAGAHTAVVRATDGASNTTLSSTLNFTLTAPSAPVVDSISASVSGSQVTVSGTASDVDGDLQSVEVEFDDNNTWIPVTGASTWSYVTSSLSVGSHTVKARAKDAGGLTGAETAAESFTISGSSNACYTDTVANHTTAGRVYVSNTLYYVTGSNTYLGSTYVNGGDVKSLEETSSGYWEVVTSCP